MISESVEKVISAEKQANENIQEATNNAEIIINDAKEKAKETIEKKVLEANKQRDLLLSENASIADKIMNEAKEQAEKSAEETAEKVKAKMNNAIEEVVRFISM